MSKKRTPEDIIAGVLLTRKRPVTRQRLAVLTGMSDRDVREVIERLRRRGLPVMSTPAKAGYWIAKGPDEVTGYIRAIQHKHNVEMLSASSMDYAKIEEFKEELNV